MKEKSGLITNGFIQYTHMCSGGQVRKQYYPTVFDQIKTQVKGEETDMVVTDEDIETGFMLFSAIVYCSESVPLSQFLHSLLSTQSPRTIIQATINTIQAEDMKERITRKLLNSFYLALDNIFHLHHGKILLASSSPSQLQAMMAKDWPYFTSYSMDIDQCLNNKSCQAVRNLTKDLGKALNVSKLYCNMYLQMINSLK